MVPLRLLPRRTPAIHARPGVPRRRLLRPGSQFDVPRSDFQADFRAGRRSQDTRPVRGSRRQDDASFDPGRSRRPGRRQRGDPPTGFGIGRKCGQMGDRKHRGDQQRPGAFRSVRTLFRPDRRGRSVLGRRHVPQRSGGAHRVERTGRQTLRGTPATHPQRHLGFAASRRAPVRSTPQKTKKTSPGCAANTTANRSKSPSTLHGAS